MSKSTRVRSARSPLAGARGMGLAGIALVGLVGGAVHAAPVTIVDTTAGSATNDGTINTGEYVGSSTGINSDFGNVIGSAATLFVDSSLGGALNFALRAGGGSLNDRAVIYIDSVSGGFADTTTIGDTADAGRAAISGNGTGGGTSEVTFAPGFLADYAIVLESNFAGLFQLAAGGANSLIFVTSANLNPSGNAGAVDREFDLTLANIGLSAGAAAEFDYVATYLNSSNAFRSNEFQGVAQSTVPGSVGQTTVTLAAGDFNTFVTVPEPATAGLLGVVTLLLGIRRRKA